MSRSKLLPVVSALSLGVGGLLGAVLERSKGANDTQLSPSRNREDYVGKYYLPLPIVYASIAPISNIPTAIPEQSPAVKLQSGSNISEIMKYGFPSLDNIRSFDDFVLAYDKRNRTAHWVFEHLTHDKVKHAEGIDRQNSEFVPDDSIHEYFRARNEDYKGSGYDRGTLGSGRQSQVVTTSNGSNLSP